MDGSPTTRLSGGEFSTESPENSSGWPWMDSSTDTVWYHHEDVDPVGYEGYLGSAVYLTLLGLVAITGNAISIRVFITEKEFREKEHNSFVLNLAISDLGLCVFAYPSSTISGYAGKWLLGDTGCTVYGFICFTCSLNSMVTLCAISVYRYIIICQPKYAYLLTHRRTMYVIIGIWLYVLLFSILPLVGVNRYTYEPIRNVCSLDWNVQYPGETAYIAVVIVLFYVVKVSIMFFCYFNIIYKSVNLKFAALASEKAKMAAKKDIWTTSVMCLAMVTSFLISWTPYAVSAAWTILSEDELPIMAIILPTLFAKTSCMMNPIIYCCFNKKFRKAAVKSFHRLGCYSNQTTPLDTVQVVPRNMPFTVEPVNEALGMEVFPSCSADAS